MFRFNWLRGFFIDHLRQSLQPVWHSACDVGMVASRVNGGSLPVHGWHYKDFGPISRIACPFL